MRKEIVAIACTSADGSPAVPFFEVEVTEEQYDLGEHYDIAIDKAMDERYERPFVCFDTFELGHIVAAGKLATNFLSES